MMLKIILSGTCICVSEMQLNSCSFIRHILFISYYVFAIFKKGLWFGVNNDFISIYILLLQKIQNCFELMKNLPQAKVWFLAGLWLYCLSVLFCSSSSNITGETIIGEMGIRGWIIGNVNVMCMFKLCTLPRLITYWGVVKKRRVYDKFINIWHTTASSVIRHFAMQKGLNANLKLAEI